MSATPTPSQKDISTYRILVVEDEPDNLESFVMLLEMLRQDVRGVPDGATALQAAREFRPEIALIDIGLPDMDGCEVGTALRAELGHGLRLIAVTGFATASVRARTKAAGFDMHLIKPIDIDVFQTLLDIRYSEGF